MRRINGGRPDDAPDDPARQLPLLGLVETTPEPVAQEHIQEAQ